MDENENAAAEENQEQVEETGDTDTSAEQAEGETTAEENTEAQADEAAE